MKEVKPTVIKIAQTGIDIEGMVKMLRMYNVYDDTVARFIERAGENPAETLVELAGKVCYKSWEVGLNPNVKKVRSAPKEYIENLLKSLHGSVIEHGTVTFALLNISRICSHEIVRHRVGVAISQESMRFVRPTDIGFWIPDELSSEQHLKIESAVQEIEKLYRDLESTIDWGALTFEQKKRYTSALRRIIPDGIATNLVWTANHRTLRHVVTMRTDPAAEVEIRMVFDQVAQILKRDFPILYGDFERTELPDGTGQWKPKWVKI